MVQQNLFIPHSLMLMPDQLVIVLQPQKLSAYLAVSKWTVVVR